MNNDTHPRAGFASKLGIILATAGSAVGLGNIWRFPIMTSENGGAVFILIYVISVALLGLPLMVAEFAIGRRSQMNTAQAYGHFTRHPFWRHAGKMGVFTGWFILSYYVVVSGWTLGYMIDAILGRFNGLEAVAGQENVYAQHFESFVSNPYVPLLCMTAFVLGSHFVLTRGVQKGIERISKVLMPLLFIILVMLAVVSVFTEGAQEGLTFLFTPDLSKVTFGTWLSAIGQAFFSLSLGMGCLCTYASYFSADTPLVGTAVKISVIDTLVAIMAGVIIFPAVFSTNIPLDSGASLVFIALPGVFQQAFSGMPLLGQVVAVMFYFLLVLATFTSAISIQEVPTAYLSERFRLSRQWASGIVSAVCIVVGALCSLSKGPLRDIRIFGRDILDFFDFASGQFLLPVGGLLITLFAGWVMRRSDFADELSNNGRLRSVSHPCIIALLRYFIPFAILLIFLSGIGVFDVLF